MPFWPITRRELLKLTGVTAASGLSSALLSSCGIGAGAVPPGNPGPSMCAKLGDIEHVVILIQENRSFDHYFGSYRGVRGFSDQNMAFQQSDPANTTNPPIGTLLPFHLDIATTNAACTHDITHDWVPQHQSWNNGAMDGFVTSRLPINSDDAVLAMGYYNRADLPFSYAVADAFTLCDNYFCSVMGPTDPTVFTRWPLPLIPDGKTAARCCKRSSPTVRLLRPLHLHHHARAAAGARNFLEGLHFTRSKYFERHVLGQRALLFQEFPGPLVSALSTSLRAAIPCRFPGGHRDERPPAGFLAYRAHRRFRIIHRAPALFGESTLSAIIGALMANPLIWKNTVLFVTFDENGGFFDHVAPAVAPPGTPGELRDRSGCPRPHGHRQPADIRPIGLGFRVPMLIVSPFSRGGFVSSDLFDHTSMLRFLETRFGAEVPNLSAWRRATVGDMTTALNLAAPDQSIPTLPSTLQAIPQILQECADNLVGTQPYPVPNPQASPVQESGTAVRPSGIC